MVDVLRRGNQELFHSSMLAWLFDAEAEHGFGDRIIRLFAEQVSEQGHPGLLDLVRSGDLLRVSTERTGRPGRYDLVVEADGVRCIIENKVKSLGNIAQLLRYERDEGCACVIPLGLTKATFKPEVPNVVTYDMICDLLDAVEIEKNNDWHILIAHYRKYLRMQLDLFMRVEKCYAGGDFASDHRSLTQDLGSWALSTDNDRRVMNQFLLELFRARHLMTGPYQADDWHSHKDDRSGAWLAGSPSRFEVDSAFVPDGHPEAKFWIHLELHGGPYAEDPEDHAGEIQLRASTSGSNRQLLKHVQAVHTLAPSERFSARIVDSWRSFFVLARSLKKREITLNQLEVQLGEFLARCGKLN